MHRHTTHGFNSILPSFVILTSEPRVFFYEIRMQKRLQQSNRPLQFKSIQRYLLPASRMNVLQIGLVVSWPSDKDRWQWHGFSF